MKKLLHERLREWSECICPLNEAMYAYEIDESSYDDEVKKLFLLFADEIERYYIPRPRFETGEPVQDSDMEEIGCLATCCVYTDGSWVFEPDKYEDSANPKQWDRQSGTISDRIKRPQPKVLDADGVEIKVGDTVWHVIGCEKGEVINFDHDRAIVNWGEHGIWGYFGEALTHKEPDSLEKLRDRMYKAWVHMWADHVPLSEGEMHNFIDDLSALIERGA